MKRYSTKWFYLVFILITFDYYIFKTYHKSNYYLLSINQKAKSVCYTGFDSQQMITKSNVTSWHLYGSGLTYLLNGNETKRSVIKLSRGVNLHLLNVRRSLPWLTAFIMDVPSRLCLPQAGGTHSSLRSTKRNFPQTKCSCISNRSIFSCFLILTPLLVDLLF